MIITKWDNFINEKLGVNYDLIEQGRAMFKIMYNDKTTKKEYKFTYKPKETNISREFKVIIDKRKKSKGSYNQLTNTITLREIDFSTLIHELQHLDYSLRTDKVDYFRKIKNNLIHIDGDNMLINVLYLMDENEFRSRYLDFYNDINVILHYSKQEGVDINKEYIDTVINSTIMKDTILFIYYFIAKDGVTLYKFLNVLSDYKLKDRDIDYLLYKSIKSPEVDKEPSIIKSMIKHYAANNIIGPLRKMLNVYSNSDKLEIQKIKNKLEKITKLRAEKYRRKLNRVYTLMYEKWL